MIRRIEKRREAELRAEGLWDEEADGDAGMTDPLERIAAALERLAPAPMPAPDFAAAEAFVWHTAPDRLEPVARVARVDLSLLIGVDRSRDTLLENTRHFAAGLPANNALLWGARGMGKSSLVKAVHARVRAEGLRSEDRGIEPRGPALGAAPAGASARRAASVHPLLRRPVVFSHDDQHYKSLKAVLDGGIEGRPENVLLLRHLATAAT